jgi:hypothetical protein
MIQTVYGVQTTIQNGEYTTKKKGGSYAPARCVDFWLSRLDRPGVVPLYRVESIHAGFKPLRSE